MVWHYIAGGGTLCALSLSVVDEEKKGNQARAESQIDSERSTAGRRRERRKEQRDQDRVGEFEEKLEECF